AAGRETAIEAAVEVAEIDVEILGLEAHIADDADFEAGADSPAGVSDAAARQDRQGQGGVDVANPEPAGKVGQQADQALPPAPPRPWGGHWSRVRRPQGPGPGSPLLMPNRPIPPSAPPTPGPICHL